MDPHHPRFLPPIAASPREPETRHALDHGEGLPGRSGSQKRGTKSALDLIATHDSPADAGDIHGHGVTFLPMSMPLRRLVER